MIVRLAESDDADALLVISRAFHAEDGHPLSPEGVGALLSLLTLASPNGRVLVAEERSQLVGYAVLCFGFSVEYGGRDAFVDDVYVLPKFRGAGFARALMDAAECAAIASGVRYLHLEVMPENTIGSWYERRGYSSRSSRLMTKVLTEDI
jgi:ribosomal protein S18 acetylase RimI-like enzyme